MWNDFPPVRALRVADVDGDDPAARGLQVRSEPEHRSVVVNKRVVGIEVGEQFHHRLAKVLQILIEKAITCVGALRDRDDQITPVVGDGATEAPFLLVGPMIHQFVFGLRGAEPMVIELLEKQGAFEFVLLLRFVETAVEESFPILRPGSAGEPRPLHEVGKILSGANVAHAPLEPVRAGGGQRVRHQIAIIRNRIVRQGHRPVGRELIRIEQNRRLRVERSHGEKHALILQTVVLREKVATALFEGHPVPFVIPELCQSRPDSGQFGNVLQISDRDFVLRVHPRLGLRRIVILQPAIRVGDFHAVVIIDDVGFSRDGIRGAGCPGILRGRCRTVGKATVQKKSNSDARRMTNDERRMTTESPKGE